MNDLDAKNYIEALIFSASEPFSKQSLKKMLSEYGDFNLEKIIDELKSDYESRGVVLMSVDDKFYFRTSAHLQKYLIVETKKTKNLSNAAIETLAIIAYHQPVTRAEIEKIRGKPVFIGTLDALLELKWIKPSGRKKIPGNQ